MDLLIISYGWTTLKYQTMLVASIRFYILNFQADVIVNTTNGQLVLDRGQGVSRCISQAAGSTIQDQLKRDYPNGIKHGEVAESGPGNIKTCKTIYHGALPSFPEKGSPNYEKEEEECFKVGSNAKDNACLIAFFGIVFITS